MMKKNYLSFKRATVAMCLIIVCWLPSYAAVMMGDVNSNGSVNISDVTELIDYLLSGNASAISLANADCDHNGSVNISDVTELIDYLLSGTWSWSESDHEWVDLGLPSGTLWATCNVGADSPEEYGDYFAWGETEPKDYYDWSTYKWCNGSYKTLTKYCTDSDYGYNGFIDGKTKLDPEDDVAYVNWGSSWRMPTPEQCEELTDNCTIEWTTRNGVNGRLVTGPIGSTLFFPAAGYRWQNSLLLAGSFGLYWSHVLGGSDYPNCAYYLGFNSGEWSGWGSGGGRNGGFTVRAVRVP